MSGGSFAGLFQYIKKIFKVGERFEALSDPRREPTIKMAPILMTWLFGMARRLPSTERVGEMFVKPGWQRRIGMRPPGRSLARMGAKEKTGSPDVAGRVLDRTDLQEWHALSLDLFFNAQRAGLLSKGPFGLRCAVLDLNELFKSEKRCCPDCQERTLTRKHRDGTTYTVTQYFHQAVLMLWISDDLCWPIDWEVLRPGEGEMTASLRLLERTLPRLGNSLDLVLGDQLYNARPFFRTCLEHGCHGLAAYGTEDKATKAPRTTLDAVLDVAVREAPDVEFGKGVALWERLSTAWQADLRSSSQLHGASLRLIEMQRRYDAPAWKHERRQLRVITTAPAALLAREECWDLGRGRWRIENEGFGTLTSQYNLTHNYRHSVPAILALLILRGLALAMTLAYRRHAIARSHIAARWSRRRWYSEVIEEDFTRFLDNAVGESRGRAP